jgi:hypothetical protein
MQRFRNLNKYHINSSKISTVFIRVFVARLAITHYKLESDCTTKKRKSNEKSTRKTFKSLFIRKQNKTSHENLSFMLFLLIVFFLLHRFLFIIKREQEKKQSIQKNKELSSKV